jgi:pimeloyl-ACP methyl ester carboxylesterase
MKLHHRELGEGQAFVILHGLFGYSDNWQTHAKKIASYYRVILVDQRNHGHSDWDDEISYPLMATDLKELLVDLKLNNIVLLGHSMGGKTAMVFAQLYPDYIDKLIVVDIGIKEYPMHHNEILKGIKAIDIKSKISRSDAENQMAKYIESFGVRQFLLKNLYWNEQKMLAWRMNVKALEEHMKEILSSIHTEKEIFIPSLFIRGALSNYILDEDWKEIENQFPDASLITIDNAGHWVHAEAPDEFLEAVLCFCFR